MFGLNILARFFQQGILEPSQRALPAAKVIRDHGILKQRAVARDKRL
jgi:hypothetical protein